MKCKKLINGICTHYNKANPPDHICEICKFYEEDKKDICSKYKSGNWCIKRDYPEKGTHTYRPYNKRSCAKCDWE